MAVTSIHTVYSVPDHPSPLPVKLPCPRVQLRTAMPSYRDEATDTSSHLFQFYFYFSPFLSSSKNFPSSFMLLQINSEKGLRVAEWLISFFSTLLPISSKVTVPKNGL